MGTLGGIIEHSRELRGVGGQRASLEGPMPELSN